MSDHVDDLLALFALGGLEAEERERVEAHLADCETCRQEAVIHQALVSVVAQSASPVEPSAETRARLLSRIQVRRPEARPRFSLRLLQPLRRWAVPAVAGAALLTLLVWNLVLVDEINFLRRQMEAQQQVMEDFRQELIDLNRLANAQQQAARLITAPTTRAIELTRQAASFPEASGSAYVDAANQRVVIVVRRLPPLGPDQTYQIWVITADGPLPSLLFSVNPEGWGMTTVEVSAEMSNFSGFGVSVEPAGGSQTTPTEVVLAGGL